MKYKSIAKVLLDPYNANRDCKSDPISSPNTLFRKRLHPLQFLSFFANNAKKKCPEGTLISYAFVYRGVPVKNYSCNDGTDTDYLSLLERSYHEGVRAQGFHKEALQ